MPAPVRYLQYEYLDGEWMQFEGYCRFVGVLQFVDALFCRGAGSIPVEVPGFFIALTFRSHYGPGVDSGCDRSEYQESFQARPDLGTIEPPVEWVPGSSQGVK